jgi:Fe-S cluster assembly protein SufD
MTLQTKIAPGAAYLDRFAAGRARAVAPWLLSLQAAGRAAFERRGFPTAKAEAWRYTPLAGVLAGDFAAGLAAAPVRAETLPALVFGREARHRLVFVNGRFRADLSALGDLPKGVTATSLAVLAAAAPDRLAAIGGDAAAAARPEHPLAALNAAMVEDGLVLHVTAGATVEAPIEVLWVGTGAERPPVYHPRNVVVLDSGAHATLVEHHVGLCIGAYFANSATDVRLADGAVLRHCKVQDESREAFHIALTDVAAGVRAQYDSFVFQIGGRLARNEISVRLGAPGASTRLNGAYLGRGEQLQDSTSVVDHAAPETASKQLYKGVLDGGAKGVFQGKVIVRPGAQKADGHQMNRALLLSDRAEIASKPELEINADDVKCSHGAAAGELDEQALFYLRARGIPNEEARRMLVEAFLGEVIDMVALTGMRLSLERNVQRWMGRA